MCSTNLANRDEILAFEFWICANLGRDSTKERRGGAGVGRHLEVVHHGQDPLEEDTVGAFGVDGAGMQRQGDNAAVLGVEAALELFGKERARHLGNGVAKQKRREDPAFGVR